VKQLTDRYSQVFRQVQSLASSYPIGAEGDKFMKSANDALANWLSLVSQQLNSAPNGGNSNY